MGDLPRKLGPYPIERELGRGGMGVVYLGRDPRLNRPVAIKVLPDAMARAPEALARFEREAKLLASVNHPNIATIYGVEEDDGHRLIVLEYIPGDTLAQRIARGPVPIGEALDICRQIALAIEAAHEAGVIHRDLKPGNVKITPDGQVKVLDFGLAKGSETVSDAELALSPTVTFAATAMGVILGTAGYMSPEQARGKAVDRRTDIWSFGCVLFECLTGRRIFEGETVSDTIARILEREPDWNALPSTTPIKVRDILRRCLEKDLKKRQRDIGDVRIQLEEAAQAPSAAPAEAPRPKSNLALALAMLLVGAAAGIGLWSAVYSRDAGTSRGLVGPIRASIAVPPTIRVENFGAWPFGGGFALGGPGVRPDGTGDQIPRVYIRGLADAEFKPLVGTERYEFLAVSPDRKWLAVVRPASEHSTERVLMKVSVDGSAPPVKIANVADEWFFMVWLESGDLLIGKRDGTKYFRLPRGSDTPGTEMPLDTGQQGAFGELGTGLPGDRGVLYYVETISAKGWSRDLWVLDLADGKSRRLFENAGVAVYADTGHIVFSRGENLMAAPFDVATLTVTGDVTAVSSGLRIPTAWQHGLFALSPTGTLVFLPGGLIGSQRRLVSIDATGIITPVGTERRPFELSPRISEQGDRIAIVLANERATYEIWIADEGRPFSRAVTDPRADIAGGVWSPDGKMLAYSRNSTDNDDGVYVTNADGTGTPRRVIGGDGPGVAMPNSWARDGSGLIVTKSMGSSGDRLLFVPLPSAQGMAAPRELRPGVKSSNAKLSPNGRVLAFESAESGKGEVYVASYGADGALGRPLMVSSGGGRGIEWAADGRRLFFGTTDRKLMMTVITPAPSLTASTPTLALDLEKSRLHAWTVRPDGSVLAIQRAEAEGDITHLTVVFNWFDELRARTGKR